MRKPAVFVAALVLTVVSVALAAQPRAMACDAWMCKGVHCAPAKYARVRMAPTILPLFASPTFGAAVVESGIGLGVFLLGSAISRRRRATIEAARPTPAPRETTET